MSNSCTLQVAHFLIQTTDISFRMFQKFRVTPLISIPSIFRSYHG